MSTIEWQDPPKSQTHPEPKHVTPEVEAALRAFPGKWALLGTAGLSARASVYSWCKRRPGFEMTSRGSGDATRVYVRFVGEQS